MAHITGGGITENLPRILPKNISAEIDTASWPLPPLFAYLQQLGNVPQVEMLRTFNMGIGMVIICAPSDVAAISSHVEARGQTCREIGRVVAGPQEVSFV
jgi:phosphoribosylformylglycinamidine cyclo-ligase